MAKWAIQLQALVECNTINALWTSPAKTAMIRKSRASCSQEKLRSCQTLSDGGFLYSTISLFLHFCRYFCHYVKTASSTFFNFIFFEIYWHVLFVLISIGDTSKMWDIIILLAVRSRKLVQIIDDQFKSWRAGFVYIYNVSFTVAQLKLWLNCLLSVSWSFGESL